MILKSFKNTYESGKIKKGGETVTVRGTNLPTGFSSLLVGSSRAHVISVSSEEITFISPKLTPGLYDLNIPAGTIGNTKLVSFFRNNYIQIWSIINIQFCFANQKSVYETRVRAVCEFIFAQNRFDSWWNFDHCLW